MQRFALIPKAQAIVVFEIPPVILELGQVWDLLTSQNKHGLWGQEAQEDIHSASSLLSDFGQVASAGQQHAFCGFYRLLIPLYASSPLPLLSNAAEKVLLTG